MVHGLQEVAWPQPRRPLCLLLGQGLPVYILECLDFPIPTACENMTYLWPATCTLTFQFKLGCMRSSDQTATQICTVTSVNRNLHSENTMMQDTFVFPRVGLGNHRHTCLCLLQDEPDDAQPLTFFRAARGMEKSTCQLWLPNHPCGLKHWEVPRIYAIWGGGGNSYRILSARKSTAPLIQDCQRAAGLGGQTHISNKYEPSGAPVDTSHSNLPHFYCLGTTTGKAFKIKVGPWSWLLCTFLEYIKYTCWLVHLCKDGYDFKIRHRHSL